MQTAVVLKVLRIIPSPCFKYFFLNYSIFAKKSISCSYTRLLCSLRTHAGAQLNSLRQMYRLNAFTARKVGNRACHLQDAVMTAGAEVEQPICVP